MEDSNLKSAPFIFCDKLWAKSLAGLFFATFFLYTREPQHCCCKRIASVTQDMYGEQCGECEC